MNGKQNVLFPDFTPPDGEPNPMVRRHGPGPDYTQCKTCRHLYGKKLALEYFTLELTIAHPEIRKFLIWIRNRPYNGKIQVKRSTAYGKADST